MSDNDAVLLEDIDHKIDLILEAHVALAPLPQKVNDLDERLTNLEAEVKVIKKVVTDESKLTRRHGKQLNDLWKIYHQPVAGDR